LVNSSYSTNHLFSPSQNSFVGRLLSQNGRGLAGVQGLAAQLYQTTSERGRLIQDLRGRISRSTSLQETALLQAQLSAEQNALQTEQNQLLAVQVLASSQQGVVQQQREEARQQEIEQELAQAQSRGY
jgi:type IV secretion system protein VirB5